MNKKKLYAKKVCKIVVITSIILQQVQPSGLYTYAEEIRSNNAYDVSLGNGPKRLVDEQEKQLIGVQKYALMLLQQHFVFNDQMNSVVTDTKHLAELWLDDVQKHSILTSEQIIYLSEICSKKIEIVEQLCNESDALNEQEQQINDELSQIYKKCGRVEQFIDTYVSKMNEFFNKAISYEQAIERTYQPKETKVADGDKNISNVMNTIEELEWNVTMSELGAALGGGFAIGALLSGACMITAVCLAPATAAALTSAALWANALKDLSAIFGMFGGAGGALMLAGNIMDVQKKTQKLNEMIQTLSPLHKEQLQLQLLVEQQKHFLTESKKGLFFLRDHMQQIKKLHQEMTKVLNELRQISVQHPLFSIKLNQIKSLIRDLAVQAKQQQL